MLSGGLKEAVRSVHVSYPVPFLATLLCLIGLGLAGLARAFQGGERWLVLGIASLMFLVAVATILKAVFVSPALFRSERHLFFERMMEVTGDEKTDPATRERLQAKLIESWDEPHAWRPVGRSRFQKRDDKEGVME